MMSGAGSDRSHRRVIVRRLQATVAAPGEARALLRRLAPPDDRLDDVAVALSELVSNSVLHSRTAPAAPIEVRLELGPGTLRLEILDRGPGFDPAAVPSPDDRPGGRGLLAVHRLADRWGTRAGDPCCTWAEFWLKGGLSRHAGGPDAPFAAAGPFVHLRAGRADLAARHAALVARRRRVEHSLRQAARRQARIADIMRDRAAGRGA